MDLETAYAKWTLGMLYLHELPEITIQGLQDGYNGTTLRKLIGVSDLMGPEAKLLFNQAMQDTGHGLFSKERAALVLCRNIAKDILSQKAHPYIGCLEIIQIAQKADNPPPLETFIELEADYCSSAKETVITQIMTAAEKLGQWCES